MGDLLVRNVADTTKAALKKKAKAAGKSLNELVRETLEAVARPSKQEVWAAADRLRERIRAKAGHDLSDSTADIRADRDNDDPYR